MLRGIIRAALATAAALAVTTVGVTSAQAASDTGWVPDGPYDPYTIDACGTQVTVSDKVNRVESRTREDNRGNVRIDYRGKYVVRVEAADGRKVVLDNSGPYSVFVYANDDVYTRVFAPALISPLDPAESEAFRRAGLPQVFYFTQGRLELSVRGDRAKVLTKPKNPVSLCKLLR